MITYARLENISYEMLYKSFMQSFAGARITQEATYETFCEMLEENNYDPTISIGAFDSKTNELVSFVLNSILKNGAEAYDILTGTIADYRRQGISRTIFDKVKVLLKEKQVELYTTEVKRNNIAAINLYQSVGFKIKEEIISVIKIQSTSRNVEQYKIVMKL